MDATTIYWSALCNGGSIMSAPKTDLSPTILVAEQREPSGIAIDDSALYWELAPTTGMDAAVVKAPISGGAPFVLASGQVGPTGKLMIDDISLYWRNAYDKVMSVAKAGTSPPMEIASGFSVTNLAQDAAYIYWIDSRTIFREPKGTIQAERIAEVATAADQLYGLVVTDDSLYCWREYQTGDQSAASDLLMVDKLTRTVTTVLRGRPAGPPVSVDAGFLYWGEHSGLVRMPVGGESIQDVVGDGVDVATPIAFDSDYVYWVRNRGTTGAAGSIYRAPK